MKVTPTRAVAIVVCALLFGAGPAKAEPRSSPVPMSTRAGSYFEPGVTGAQTRELEGGVVLRIAPNTQLRQLRRTRLQLSGNGATPTHVFSVTRGRVDVTVPAGPGPRFAVLLVGPKGQASVTQQGTSTLVAQPSAVRISVVDGSILTGKGSRWRKLDAGETLAVDPKTGQARLAPRLQAPRVAVVDPLQVALPGQSFATSVRLSPVNGADRYQVVILKRDGADWKPADFVETKAPVATVSGHEPGSYVVVARALDGFGLGGTESAPEAVRAMGVSLPRGASASAAGVRLAPRSRLGLVAVDGLQMTYGSGNYFVAAADSVGLGRGVRTEVRFRDPRSGDEAALTLLPHVVRAQVDLGPKTAVWPADAVRLEVKLFDGEGNPLDDSEGVDARVSVNLESVDVKWRRSHNALSADLRQPPSIHGPWVVRVEVEHESLGLLAQDFLEVAEAE